MRPRHRLGQCALACPTRFRPGHNLALPAQLLGELLVAPPTRSQLRLFPQAPGNVLLVDATYLGQPGATGDDWRLHTAYHVMLGRLVQVTLTAQLGGEHLGW